MMMKGFVAIAVLLAMASLGTGALLSHGPQLRAISWSNGTLGVADAWSQEIRLTDAELDSMQPVVARDANDDLHVVWSDARTGEYDVYYKKVDATGRVLVEYAPRFTLLNAAEPPCGLLIAGRVTTSQLPL